MTKRERIQAAIAKQKTDKIPYSLWSHLPGIDLDPVELAERTWEFYKKLDIDFIKTMNNGVYCIEDFGCVPDYSEIKKGGIAKIVETPVKTIDDWDNVPVVDCCKGALARELYSLELLVEKRRKANDDIPIIFTVFSPMTIADKLSNKLLLTHIAEGGEAKIKGALERITASMVSFVQRVIEIGADGIFLATQMSNYDETTEAIYKEYGVPYDIQVIEASKGWFNAIHCHGDNIMFDLLKSYPVQVFNWHVWETYPDLDEGIDLSGKCVMGGIGRMTITKGDKNSLRSQIYHTIKTTGGRGLILTPGCVVRYPLDDEMLAYVRRTKEEIEQLLLAGE